MSEPLSDTKISAIRRRLAELPALANMFGNMGGPMIATMRDLKSREVIVQFMNMLARSPYIATLEATASLAVPALLVEVERLKAKSEAMEAVLRDLAESGLRCDMRPTLCRNKIPAELGGGYDGESQVLDYFARQEARLKERAGMALTGEKS